MVTAPVLPPTLSTEPSGHSFDEYRDGEGKVRPHQELLAGFLSEHPAADLELLRQAVRRRITEQEVTFNILGVPEGTNRPWQLDPIPLVIARTEWEELCVGLRQRARLLNAVIADC